MLIVRISKKRGRRGGFFQVIATKKVSKAAESLLQENVTNNI